MIVNKESLSSVKYLEINLVEGETFVIYSKNIVDIYFEIEKEDKNYYATNGFIVFDKKAQQTIENDGDDDATFSEYLDSYADIYTITLHKQDGSSLRFFTEYDPIISVKSLEPIHFSNCPSLEFLPNKNMRVLFGKSSKNSRRTDNDYSQISNYSTVFGNYMPEIFNVNVNKFAIEKTENMLSLLANITILNEDSPIKEITVNFTDIDTDIVKEISKTSFVEGEFNYFVIEDEGVYVSFGEDIEFFAYSAQIL